MKVIKAKPGIFKGIQYRSRLEIMWAAFFDYFGIEFSYEPERFNLKSGSYLPDFYLKNVSFKEGKFDSSQNCVKGLWFEVKNPLHCTELVSYAAGKLKYRELDESSKPFRLMEELTMQTSLQNWDIQNGYYDCTQITPGVIVWFTPLDMYLELNRYEGSYVRVGEDVVDNFTPSVQIANETPWRANCMFWKCPECKTISFSRSRHLEDDGLAHTETCKQSKGLRPRRSLEDYVDPESTDIHIMEDHIWYGNKHEEIGVAI
jgi:hypothetical protein